MPRLPPLAVTVPWLPVPNTFSRHLPLCPEHQPSSSSSTPQKATCSPLQGPRLHQVLKTHEGSRKPLPSTAPRLTDCATGAPLGSCKPFKCGIQPKHLQKILLYKTSFPEAQFLCLFPRPHIFPSIPCTLPSYKHIFIHPSSTQPSRRVWAFHSIPDSRVTTGNKMPCLPSGSSCLMGKQTWVEPGVESGFMGLRQHPT